MSASLAVGMEGDSVTDMVSARPHFYPNTLRLVPPSCVRADLSSLSPTSHLHLPTTRHTQYRHHQIQRPQSPPVLPSVHPAPPPDQAQIQAQGQTRTCPKSNPAPSVPFPTSSTPSTATHTTPTTPPRSSSPRIRLLPKDHTPTTMKGRTRRLR